DCPNATKQSKLKNRVKIDLRIFLCLNYFV
ncbi:MAG: hypothetical protein ACI905_001140, partial [Roseivirga sp.]